LSSRKNWITHILIGLIFSLSSVVFSQNSVCQKANKIVNAAQDFHIQASSIDDAFSESIYDIFIASLDPYSVVYSDEDITKLESFSQQLDEDLKNQKCEFTTIASQLYEDKLKLLLAIFENFETENFEFNSFDKIFFSTKKANSPEDKFKDEWKNFVKLKILYNYFSNDSIPSQNSFLNQKETIKNEVLQREICRLKSRLKYEGGIQQYIEDKYLKAISEAFDPHTNYFTYNEQLDFINSLSQESESFGFEISKNEEEEIIIAEIVPGSPAWDSNLINEGDVILSMVTQNKQLKKFQCISTVEAKELIISSQEEVEFVVRKKNNKQVKVKLNKAIIDVEANVIQTFLLEGQKKCGYIYLPSFYTDMDYEYYTPKGCANDMAKELIRLKKENIKGLILDLRNNGGGSMIEAIEMAGSFIDYGSLVIHQRKGEEPTPIKDMNRGTIFDKPLIILTNTFSASASELLAGVLQDYNRAVIVGGITYGKSTSQEMLPINATSRKSNSSVTDMQNGSIKMTTGVFYRITGKSHQQEGIIPDIILPNYYDQLEITEKHSTRSLTNQSTDTKCHYKPLEKLPLNNLRTNSANRIEDDPYFLGVSTEAEKLAAQENYTYQLTYNGFQEQYLEDIDTQELEKVYAITDHKFEVKKPSYVHANEGKKTKDIEDPITQNIKNDQYIQEAYFVLLDLINYK